MTAPLTADALDLVRAAAGNRLVQVGPVFLDDGVEVPVYVKHQILDLIVDGWLWVVDLTDAIRRPVKPTDKAERVLS